MSNEFETDVVVIGSGPGGYTAAFRAADLGKKVILVERHENLGGVCLNVGCIPSKALLHAAKVIDEAKDMTHAGIHFGSLQINNNELRQWKNKVITRLTTGLKALAKQRKVEVMRGEARFLNANQIEVTHAQEKRTVQFENAIIGTGSRPIALPFLPQDPRIMDSTDALEIENTQGKMLVIGGGIIGLEMATVYHALGAKINIVELMDQLIPGCDPDVTAPLYKRIQKRYENIYLKTKVTQVEAKKDGLWVTFAGENAPKAPERFDRILSAVGRRPNGDQIGAEAAGVLVDERGFIRVDNQQRTNVPTIFAIGDVCGNPMLAHKAMPEGRIAAEVIAGKKHYFDVKCIPSVAYTDPEVAFTGVTENYAKAHNIAYGKGTFPWAASGRSLSLGRDEGMTKLIIDEKSRRIIGGAAVGPNAGELIAEIGLAIEMHCDVEDVSLTIHPHPTLSETIALAAEVFEGTITDLYLPKKKKEE